VGGGAVSAGAATVRITGLEVHGRHGVFPAERDLGQRFVVDLALDLPTCVGCTSDALTDTVDYAALAESVAAVVAGEPVALLERLAELIAGVALGDPLVGGVEVTVRKPHVALPQTVTETSVTIRRQRPPA
jgi:dihydroneopterin aldolase